MSFFQKVTIFLFFFQPCFSSRWIIKNRDRSFFKCIPYYRFVSSPCFDMYFTCNDVVIRNKIRIQKHFIQLTKWNFNKAHLKWRYHRCIKHKPIYPWANLMLQNVISNFLLCFGLIRLTSTYKRMEWHRVFRFDTP